MNHYITLLKNEKVLRQLSLIQLISYFGAWFSNVAIYTLLVQLNVSAFVVAMIAAFHFLPGVLQAPISGVLIDKFPAKKLMLFLLFIEVVSTILLLRVTSTEWIWLLFILIFIRMGAASFYFTVEMSLLPKILEGKALQYANEIHSIIWSFSYTIGMAISGLFVYKMGVSIAFIIDALLFLVSLTLLWQLELFVKVKPTSMSFLTTLKEGFIYLKSNPKIMHLILIHAAVGFTVFDALVALMAKKYYATLIAIPLALGIIHATRALALVLGPVILGKWINVSRLSYLLLFQGVMIIVWSRLIESFYLTLLGAFLAGFFTTTLWSYTYTLIQQHTDKNFYGRVVAYNDMIFLSTSTFSSFMVGVLIEQGLSIMSVFALIGIMFILAAWYFIYIRRSYDV